ncbi:hypothetical protein GT037_006036 [Alternaria burnsii]|uniref:Uncharacterized protein n=1 Tax=Alternaria burnsii TaxID=1187904 RepID=A0A8H7B7F7_9PLEO|nr:uncharacterized protein GT037_006036 [Alternaria burnsii]KAF7676531.1 hypothetical protein GT037_006036 [Alternaria burnsii]
MPTAMSHASNQMSAVSLSPPSCFLNHPQAVVTSTCPLCKGHPHRQPTCTLCNSQGFVQKNCDPCLHYRNTLQMKVQIVQA